MTDGPHPAHEVVCSCGEVIPYWEWTAEEFAEHRAGHDETAPHPEG